MALFVLTASSNVCLSRRPRDKDIVIAGFAVPANTVAS